MPVEFLTDDEAAAYGRYTEVPSQADLERVFFLDDEDRALALLLPLADMKLGFALQLVTVRWLGTFLQDPLEMPAMVADFVAAQLEVADPSQVKRYTGRTKTRFDHQWEIRQVYGLQEFPGVEKEFAGGWRPGRGRPATARRRSSSTGLRGCGNGRCCCRG